MGLVASGTFCDTIVGRGNGRERRQNGRRKKMGRPTDNPKGRPIHVRLDAEADAILEAYCVRENVTRAEAIRRGISLLNKQN